MISDQRVNPTYVRDTFHFRSTSQSILTFSPKTLSIELVVLSLGTSVSSREVRSHTHNDDSEASTGVSDCPTSGRYGPRVLETSSLSCLTSVRYRIREFHRRFDNLNIHSVRNEWLPFYMFYSLHNNPLKQQHVRSILNDCVWIYHIG